MRRQDRARAIRLSADTGADTLMQRIRAERGDAYDVVPVKLPVVGSIWLALSHEAVGAVLKDSERFGMRKTAGGEGDVAGLAWWMPKTIRILTHNMLALDDPDHRRLRGLVDDVFARRAVLAMEPLIEAHARTLLRQAKTEHDSNRGAAGSAIDLMAAYARPLPLLVICDLLGVPELQREAFAHDAGQLSGIAGIASFIRALWPLRRLRKQVEALIEQSQTRLSLDARAEPVGLIDDLVLLQRDGHALSHNELIAMVFLLLMAGQETTTHAISGSVLALVRAKADGAGSFEDAIQPLGVEECLRFVSPVQLSKPRFVLSSGPFMGVQLEAGDLIMASLACANHDCEKFEDADKFNLSRKPNPHLEFGAGAHFCLGHQLARLELQVALRVLAKEWPDFEIDLGAVTHQPRLGLAVVKTLPVLPDGYPD